MGLSPFLIILGMTIGGGLFGIWGMLLTSAITAVIKLYMGRWFGGKISRSIKE